MHIAKKNIHTKLYTYNLNIFYSADLLLGILVVLPISFWYLYLLLQFIYISSYFGKNTNWSVLMLLGIGTKISTAVVAIVTRMKGVVWRMMIAFIGLSAAITIVQKDSHQTITAAENGQVFFIIVRPKII